MMKAVDHTTAACSSCRVVLPVFRIEVRIKGHTATSDLLCAECVWSGEESLASVEFPETVNAPAPPSRGMKKRSQQQETLIAKDIGGRTQPGSGNQGHAKGDVRKKNEQRVEAKFTYGKSYRVDLADLNKIRSEAVYPEKPAFVVEFVDKMTGRQKDQWVLIPYNDWTAYIDAARNDK